MTLVVKSALATAFLQLAEKPVIEVHNIEGLGEVGLLQLSLSAQQKWSAAEKSKGSIVLLKNTVCDPETGDLVLNDLDDEKLQQLPLKVVNDILKHVFKQNGILTKTEQDQEPEELKNSTADQN